MLFKRTPQRESDLSNRTITIEDGLSSWKYMVIVVALHSKPGNCPEWLFYCTQTPEFAVVTALKKVLPHFRCRLGGSTRRKSLYPTSLATVYRPFGRSRFSGSAVQGLMDATPVCSTGWRCATVSRLHRKCGRTLQTENFAGLFSAIYRLLIHR